MKSGNIDQPAAKNDDSQALICTLCRLGYRVHRLECSRIPRIPVIGRRYDGRHSYSTAAQSELDTTEISSLFGRHNPGGPSDADAETPPKPKDGGIQIGLNEGPAGGALVCDAERPFRVLVF